MEKRKETVHHPQHYNMGKYEVIVVIEDWKLGFHLGNTVKYIGRCGHKENVIEDLKKAKWYLHRKIEILSCRYKESFFFKGRCPNRISFSAVSTDWMLDFTLSKCIEFIWSAGYLYDLVGSLRKAEQFLDLKIDELEKRKES